MDDLFTHVRSHGFFPYLADLSCCGVEMRQAFSSRYDLQRFGANLQISPNQADVLIVAGTITHKMVPLLKQAYDEMPGPKSVMAIGGCAIAGGPFDGKRSYSSVSGLDLLVPVDVLVPGCPPRPEAVLHGVMLLQEKMKQKGHFVK